LHPDTSDGLSRQLLDALMRCEGVNDLLHRLLLAVASETRADRVALHDYDEIADSFELLYFHGHAAHARSELKRKLGALDPRRALRERTPYTTDPSGRSVLVPLYFQEMLEGVLVLERDGSSFVDDPRQERVLPVVSRFLGLVLSSLRLPANQKRRGAVVADLERAREIQLSYLPVEYPTADRYEIFGYNQSATLVGGDYFDYFSDRPGSIQCVVADACGHGLAAALIMSTFRGLLQSEVRNTDALASLFARLNARIFGGSGQVQYLTGVFVDFDEETGVLRYWNAGHFEPLLVHADGTTTALCGGGLPLGMFQESGYETCSRRVAPGDLLVLFTDGLAELKDEREEFFGVEGILRAVLPVRHLPLRDVAAGVLDSAVGFHRGGAPDDDLTLFLMRFR
jgi:sigma-B regulation protein RsbU (phosphoserine phosphatase)